MLHQAGYKLLVKTPLIRTMRPRKPHPPIGNRGKIEIAITFSSDLCNLLHPALRTSCAVERSVDNHTSVKDLIESLRIPHTEIGGLTVNGFDVDFSYRPKNRDSISAIAHAPGLNPCRPDRLRPFALDDIRFLVDINVAKLGALLRMAGIDSLCLPHLDDATLAETAVREGRILLSRDRNLLKRKIIVHGHLVRNQQPAKQLLEIINLYGLQNKLKPFTRCMKCNALLVTVKKEDILHRLEPLTKKYYHTFFRCSGCDNIYWSGSHKTGMEKILSTTLTHEI